MRKKAKDFVGKSGVFETKGYYPGMPFQDYLALNKLYGINPITVLVKANGDSVSKEDKEAYVSTIIFYSEDVKKLYSYDGSTSDFYQKFIKAYTKKSFIFPDYKIGNEREFLHNLKNLSDFLNALYDEIDALQKMGGLCVRFNDSAKDMGEIPFSYYKFTAKDGTVLKFYAGLNFIIQKSLKRKTTGDFE